MGLQNFQKQQQTISSQEAVIAIFKTWRYGKSFNRENVFFFQYLQLCEQDNIGSYFNKLTLSLFIYLMFNNCSNLKNGELSAVTPYSFREGVSTYVISGLE